MKKLYITRGLKFIALLVPLAAAVLLMQTYLFWYTDLNTDRLHDFTKEEKNSIDVVFMGASEVVAGIAPGYAYEKHGFTSYNYAIDANPGVLFKAQMKEILKYQTPQLIFIETEGFLYKDDADIWDESRLRIFAETIPMSANKLETIFTHRFEDKLSCLLPFIKYHGDWGNTAALKERYTYRAAGYDDPSVLMGICSFATMDQSELAYDISEDYSSKDLAPATYENLMNFLDFCREEQLDNIVFVRLPHKMINEKVYTRYLESNRVEEIIRENGFEYLDLERKAEEIGIDYMQDYYNEDHLNMYGQQKLTDYMGRLILDEYQLTPVVQSKENKALWEERAACTRAYYEIVDENIREGTDFFFSEGDWFLPILRDHMNQPEQENRTM